MQRYLVIIDYDGHHDALVAELRALALAGESAFHVVVPATAGPDEQTEGEAHVSAERRLAAIEAALADVERVDGEVGDENVYTAISDALRRRDYDVIVVATPSVRDTEKARLVDRLVGMYGRPVVPVAVAGARWLQHHPLDIGVAYDEYRRRTSNTAAPIRATVVDRGTSIRRRTVAVLVVACVVLAGTTLGAVAWGLGRGSSATPVPTITATESDFRIRLSVSHVTAGPFVLVVHNRGPSPHEFVGFRTTLPPNRLPLGPDGNVIEDARQLHKIVDTGSSVAPGTTRTLLVSLTPGRYVFVCNLPGHYRLGMRAGLVVG